MVDTGADISCVSQSFLKKVTIENPTLKKSQLYSIVGVGRQRLRILGVVNLTVKINGKDFKYDFHVIESIPHSVIIGIDFLQANKVTINVAQNSIKFPDGTAKIGLLETNTGLVRCVESCKLPPNSEAILPVHVSRRTEGEQVLLEPTPNLVKKHLMAARCTISVKQGKSVMRVLNPTDKPIFLSRRLVLAKVEEFDPHTVQTLEDKTPAKVSVINKQPRPCRENLEFDLSHSDLPENKKMRLAKFLNENKHVFATNLKELGLTDKYHHRIETVDDAPGVKMPFYRQPPHLQKETDRQITEMLENQIIVPSTSSWFSPILLLKKKDGTYRFAVDYRKLNKQTKPIYFPLPRLESVFDALGAAKATLFSVLDLASGFWQIPMDPETRHKAAFITHSGIYEWLRLPFGLSNSPATFSMVIAQVLRNLNWKFVLCYVDDILVFSSNFETHLEHLRQVFECLSKANLTLKPSKCKFAVKQVKYLGHIISEDGIKVDPDKTMAVSSFPVPKTVKEVRSFLGMCNYYRKFVKSYASLATPLTDLLQKDKQFLWTETCQASFDKLKEKLTSSPVLAYADMDKPFELTCDASDSAIGHVLSQRDNENRLRVIAYGGRALSKTERKYHTTEKECLAIIHAIKNNDTYLSLNRFTIHTDHKALCWLQNTKHKSGRLLRWAIALQPYSFDVKHIKGKENLCADALSRRTYPENNSDQEELEDGPKSQDVLQIQTQKAEITEVHLFYDHDPDTVVAALEEEQQHQPVEQRPDLATLQQQCPDFQDIYNYLNTSSLPDDRKTARKITIESQQYSILNGILYHWYQRRGRKLNEQDRMIQQVALPRVLREDALKAYHDSQSGGAHFATKRVYEAMHLRYYWGKMHQHIHDYVKSCDRCQRIKTRNQNHRAPLTPMPIADSFERWHIDILELTQTKEGFRYVLLIVDSFSRWSEAFALKSQDASSIAKVLYSEIFCRFGAPRILLSDRGQAFMSKLVNALCEIFQVKRHYTSSYHPQTNSTVERLNSTLAQCLRAYCSKNHEIWPSLLPGIMMAFRMSPATESTEFSPFYLLFGKEMNLPFDIGIQPKENMGLEAKEHINAVIEKLNIAKTIARQNIERHQEKNKDNYDKKAKEPEFRVGQKVLLRVYKIPKGLSRKLQDKSDGPYLITELGPNHTYKLLNCATNKTMKSLINAQHLRFYHDPRPLRRQDEIVDNQDDNVANDPETQQESQEIGNSQTPTLPDELATATQDDDTAYEVERLLGRKMINGKLHYKCKWSDGSPPSWEPIANISENLVEDFHIKFTQRGTRRKKRRQNYKYFNRT